MVPLQIKGLECKVVVTVKPYPNSTETEINHNKTMLLNAYPNHYNFQTAVRNNYQAYEDSLLSLVHLAKSSVNGHRPVTLIQH